MPARAPNGQLEDSYQRLLMNDFSGGLNTYTGAMSLPLNASPDMLNLVPFPGRLKYRGGTSLYCPLTTTADQAFNFYDTAGNKHFPIFEDGNLIDSVGGSQVTVANAVYTTGQRVGVCEMNGIMYWATQTVPLQYWNPAAGTHGAVAQTGFSPPPMSPYLFVYAGSIVALGVQYGAFAYQPTVMGWCVPNQPGNWNAADSQAVGPLSSGASLEFGIVLGIANTGVPPTRTIVVGRSDLGIISYTGALGSLQENAVNCPVGVKDGASAVFCPGADGFGDVIFLGSDSQFWKTNGINAVVASLPIQNLVQSAVGNAYISNPKARFFAGYNEQFAYYFCNVNDMQFVYKWDTQIWTLFQGWPNGPILNATDNNGIPSLYVASNVSSQLGLFQVGVPGSPDNTLMPSVYYKTAWLHAGDPEILKLWHWIAIMAYNTGTVYSVTARGLARSNDGSFMQTDPIYLKTAPQGTSGNPFILNVSILDGPNVLVPPGVLGLPSAPVLTHGRLACPVVWEADSMCRGYLEEVSGGGGTIYEDLKANAVQFTIAWYSGTQDFDLLGLQSRFLTRAYRREGGDQYDSEAGVPNPHDPFVYAPLLPNDTAEQS